MKTLIFLRQKLLFPIWLLSQLILKRVKTSIQLKKRTQGFLYLIIIFFAFFNIQVQAQCPPGTLNNIQGCVDAGAIDFTESVWTLTGNSGTSPNNHFIGTNDLSALAFKTNGAERLRILDNGNVGIGVIDPSELLDVNGKLRVRSLNGGSNDVLVTASLPNGVLNSISFTGSANDVLLGNGTFGSIPSSGDIDWFLENSTNPPASINDNIYTLGKVGISNPSPTEVLTIGDALGEGTLKFGGWELLFPEEGKNQSVIEATDLVGLTVVINGDENADRFSILSDPSNNGNANTETFVVLNNGNVGINTIVPEEKLHVIGNMILTGYISSFSDKRFKKDIQQLENVLDRLQKLEGYSYHYRTKEFKDRQFNEGKQIGLIAQNVDEVFPELVKTYEDGYKAVNYNGLIPLLLEGLKAQQVEINQLEKKNDKLENNNIELAIRLDDLESKIEEVFSIYENHQERVNFQEVYLGTEQQIILNQNDPNPFEERTSITYYLSESMKGAELFIHNTSGNILKRISLETGDGVVEVFASNLSSGLYIYSIVVNGKIVETKKMTVTR